MLNLQCQRKPIAFGHSKVHPLGRMDADYDVVIIGGAFSGAATALMLKRKRPEARVLIIEKTTEFDRKVGESTTEVSKIGRASCRERVKREERDIDVQK